VSKNKPLGQKAYGHIGHLPESRMGPGDHHVHEGQARICCEKVRNKHDEIIVQEKLDGSCCAVALLNDKIIPLGRAGYPAITSPFKQHHMFHDWVMKHEDRFRTALCEGERIVGEWLAQAHGTRYSLRGCDPYGVFDIMVGTDRMAYDEFYNRTRVIFSRPNLLHRGESITVDDAMKIHYEICWGCEEIEGVVYRVENRGKVDFLAKYVRPDKVDGKYLEHVTGKDPVWNWQP